MTAERNATAILVAGMHRSGTSALAGTLAHLGVPLGDHLLEAGPDNPKGYWEHKDIVMLHERLLTELGSGWDDVRPLPPRWVDSDPARRAASDLEALLARDFDRMRLWAVKDPRICRLLPLWLEVLGRRRVRPVVVLMIRNPSEVSASLAARSQLLAPVGEILWLRHVFDAEQASRGVSRSVITYTDLLDNPSRTVTTALLALGVETPPTPAGQQQSLSRFIDRRDRHHEHAAAGAFDTPFAAIADAAYGVLASIGHGGDDWSSVRDSENRFDELWLREGAAIGAVAAMVVQRDTLIKPMQARIDSLSSHLTAQVQWSDQAREKHEALYAKYADTNSKLIAQIRWSEEAQADREAQRDAKQALAVRLEEQERLLAETVAQRDALGVERDGLVGDLQRAITECTHLHDVQRGLQEELAAIRGSTAWRLTRPLRAVVQWLTVRTAPSDRERS